MIKELEKTKLKITIKPSKQVSVKYGTKAKDIFELIGENTEEMLAVSINNCIRNSDYNLVENAELAAIGYDHPDGYRIYVRTVKFMLSMAIKRLYPDLDLEVCNTIDGTVYFIVKNAEFTDAMAVELLKEMRSIVTRNSDFNRRVVTYEEAKFLFESAHDKDTLENMAMKMTPYITMYFSEDLYGITDGILAPSAKYVPTFEIRKFRKGFALLVPKQGIKDNIDTKIKESKIYDVFEERVQFSDMIDVRSIADLNNKIIDGKIPDVVSVCEAEHNQKLSLLVQDIKAKENIRMVLIAGPSSSGKTTFAKRLCVNLKVLGFNPVMISMDNYFKERVDTPLQPNGEYDFETIDALDTKLLNNNITELLKGKKVEIPEFNFLTGMKEYKGKFLELEDKDVIVIEGIHALNPELFKEVPQDKKYKIYVAPMTTLNIDDFSKVSTTDTRMLRRIVRDYNTRGHNVEKTLSMWSNLMVGENKYIYPYIKYADYIFNTSLLYEIGVLRVFAEPLLLQIDTSSRYFSEARRLYTFIQKFLPTETRDIPTESLVREFIGNASIKS